VRAQPPPRLRLALGIDGGDVKGDASEDAVESGHRESVSAPPPKEHPRLAENQIRCRESRRRSGQVLLDAAQMLMSLSVA